MVDVNCPGCSASYSLSEKRIPAAGMDMRCPQCGQTFRVTRPSDAALPALAQQAPEPAPAPKRRPSPLFGRDQQEEEFHSPAVDELFGDSDSDGDFGVIDMALPGTELDFGAPGDSSPNLPAVADDLDLPQAAGAVPPARGSGRGTIRQGSGLDLPSVAGAAPHDRPSAPRYQDDATIALPAPVDQAARNRPPRRGRSHQTDDGIDLPSPVATEADLPVAAPHHARRRPAVEADLPAVPGHADLPAVPVQADLPAVPAQADLPAVAQPDAAKAAIAPGFGHLTGNKRSLFAGLDAEPDPAAYDPMLDEERFEDHDRDAKATAGYEELFARSGSEHADLPLPAEDNLPMPALDDNLPMPALDNNLPARAHDNLPARAHDNLPARAHDNLPTPAANADLPLPADQDLPLPAPNGDLPLPADFNFPETSTNPHHAVGDMPLPPLDDGGQPFDPGFDDLDLAEDPHARFAKTERIDDLLEAEPAPISDERPAGEEAQLDTEADTFGDEFDLEGAAQRKAQQEAAGDAPKVRIQRKPSKVRRALLIAIPLLALAGGMLYLTPLGPFGAHAISDYLNREDNQAALTDLTTQSHEHLGLDTAAEARAMLTRAQGMRRDMQRYKPLTSYTSFLAFWNGLRFGTGSQDVALGKQLLASLEDSGEGPGKQLASIAQAAATGDTAGAFSRANAFATQNSGNQDALALAGEVGLLADKPKEALALFDKAAKAQPSARAAYGMARAQLALNEHAGAQKQAEKTLELSKNHAGARTLLATVLWTQNRKDEQPLKLVQEVVKKGPVKKAASRAELVLAHSLLGEIHLSRSHMTDAEKAFQEALKLDPQSQRALLGNGELLYQAGRFSEALARFEAAHRPNPKAELPLIGKAKTKIALERPKDAKAELAPIAKTSKHPLVGYWLGRAEEALGNNKNAKIWYRHALKVGAERPEVVSAYVALADLLGSEGKNEEAAKVLAEAGDNLPRSVALHNARGDVALTAGRLQDAQREFESALEIDPQFTPSRFRLAVTLRRNRQLDQAEAELKKVLDSDPEYPGLALERGLLFEERGDTEQALSMYANALKKAPDDIDLKLRVGSTQVASGHPKQAVPLLREVHTKRPRSAEVNHYLGRALLLMGDSKDALRYLQAAVRLDINRADYHLYVAWAANESGQVSAASDAVDKALELNQDLGDAYWQRAVVKQKYSRTRDALADLEIALEKNPSRHQAYATQAVCYQDQLNYTQAEASWRKAIEGDDKVAEWRFRLGKILWDRGARDDAAQHLLAAVEQAKDSKRGIGWLWNAQFLLGEALRLSNPKRAIVAYKAFLQLASPDNAYRPDAERALAQLEQR